MGGERKLEEKEKAIETIWWKKGDPPGQDVIMAKAGQILKDGGLVAFPTETVYGLGGDAFNPDSSKKIYAAKGRPSDNPLIVHICRTSDLEKVAKNIPPAAYELAKAFWPGPLTMILEKQPSLPKETTGNLDTVAVRFPSHELAIALIDAAGGFVAAPSANTSGRPSPTVGKYVYEDLAGRIDMLLDDGQAGIGLESTIVDLTQAQPMILRPGYITREMLERVLGTVGLDPALQKKAAMAGEDPAKAAGKGQENRDSADAKKEPGPKAPGMRYKHYAPKGELILLEGGEEKVSECLPNELKKRKEQKIPTGVILTKRMHLGLLEKAGEGYADSIRIIDENRETEEMAHTLFLYLRQFDEEGIGAIYIRAVEETGLGLAVMNRMKKAAGGKILSV